ncbi:DUF4326 domain-containing protein [Acaryochloris marina]|uniref:DUF4326 domain-containing protein n=1 Tax=Acaryochloris marina (strain MBIC 11017) TaxID=329726 RepID=B0C4Y1_ACAM1|nr:DUF4326 domain-containing protein [Acaryochloris marina]ABW31119.1 hypothetical protein AM1_6187 [Acaryochloris marina MBIC11017]BDM79823.1 hypothetical protein AM10699_26910 [Acaryochloris marina MBIC10699]
MPTIHIANLRKSRQLQPGVRCDRGTPLGNPFHMFAESERDRCIAAFRVFLYEVAILGNEPSQDLIRRIAEQHKIMPSGSYKPFGRGAMMAALEALGQKSEVTLLGWCHPKPCHCDVIKAFLDWKCPTPQQQTLEVL